MVAVALAAAGASAAETAGEGVAILDEKTLWRVHVAWRLPAVGTAKRAADMASDPSHYHWSWGWIRDAFSEPTPVPPADWAAPDFDAAGWLRCRAPIFGGYAGDPYAASICLRGRFGLTDPARAKEMVLHLVYRGGAAAYLNGREIGRAHLPAGEIDAATLADDYPLEAFVDASGRALLPAVRDRRHIPGELLPRYESRMRKAAFVLPRGLLRRGANVLAIRVHRSAIPADLPESRGGRWGTAGLEAVRLAAAAGSAAVPNTQPVSRAHVWNADALLRVGIDADCGDPLEALGPMRLLVCRNGACSGQVVVTTPAGAPKLRARLVAGLRSSAGGAIPPSACRIRYAKGQGQHHALLGAPDAQAAVQPVWLTVQVPADAAAGTYSGALRIEALAEPVTVPVELTVYGWTLPAPRDWLTSVNLMQSAETVARHYGVPLWSDRHFALLERSFALMGLLGNDVLSVNAVAKTVFGDDPVIVFARKDGGWTAELGLLRRYLGAYARHAPPPELLCVQVWHYGMYYDGVRRDGRIRGHDGPYPIHAKTIPIGELRAGKVVAGEMPMFGELGTEETWRATLAGVRRILSELGWRGTRLLLGTAGDAWPSERTIRFFQGIDRSVAWRVATHGSSVSRWGETEAERTQANGMVVGYANMVRRNTWRRARPADAPVSVIARDVIGTSPFDHLGIAPLAAVAANYSGFTWQGVDYWGYTGADGKRHRALAEYVGFGNIIPHRTMFVSLPGPDGAVATVQFEMLREGIQLCEAMLFLRKVLGEPASRARIGDELARRAGGAVQSTCDVLESGRRMQPHGGADVRRQIALVYAAAADVAEKLGAK